MKKIDLVFDKATTRLAGNPYGKNEFQKQVKDLIDYNDLKVGWYDLKKPLKVPTYEGDSVSNRFYFNGEVNTTGAGAWRAAVTLPPWRRRSRP